jgi:hypothetical protein
MTRASSYSVYQTQFIRIPIALESLGGSNYCLVYVENGRLFFLNWHWLRVLFAVRPATMR